MWGAVFCLPQWVPELSAQRALSTGKGLPQPSLAAPNGSSPALTGSEPSTPSQGRVTEDPELQREALPAP